MQAVFWRVRRKAVRLSRTFGLFVAALHPGPRARMEMRGSGPNRPGELGGSLVACTWLPRSRLDDRLPLPFLRPAHIPPDSIRARRSGEGRRFPCRTPCSAAAPTRCAPSCWPAPPRRASSACAPASGPATNPAARRAERPGESPTIAHMINSRLTSRWPIFDIRPRRGLPPVVCCRGTRPSQAEKSRPRRKFSIGGANARIADAVIGPTPGMLISRCASSSSRTLAHSRLSNSSIFAFRPAISSSRTSPSSRTASGRPDSAPRTATTNLVRPTGP